MIIDELNWLFLVRLILIVHTQRNYLFLNIKTEKLAENVRVI